MNRTAKIGIGLVVALVVLALGYMLVVSMRAPSEASPADGFGMPQGASGKVAATNLIDGEYYVRVREVLISPEDTVLTLSHVTYFEGEEARLSAERDVQCSGEIAACVPTLAKDYYVRESGAPNFDVPLAKNAAISFVENVPATPKELGSHMRTSSLIPVYVVRIEAGQAVEVREIGNH